MPPRVLIRRDGQPLGQFQTPGLAQPAWACLLAPQRTVPTARRPVCLHRLAGALRAAAKADASSAVSWLDHPHRTGPEPTGLGGGRGFLGGWFFGGWLLGRRFFRSGFTTAFLRCCLGDKQFHRLLKVHIVCALDLLQRVIHLALFDIQAVRTAIDLNVSSLPSGLPRSLRAVRPPRPRLGMASSPRARPAPPPEHRHPLERSVILLALALVPDDVGPKRPSPA